MSSSKNPSASPPDELSPQSSSSDSHEEIEEVATAKRLREEQDKRQRKRRKVAGGTGSSTKTSLWSTLAATIVKENSKTMYHCAVCGFNGSLNSGSSTSNIKMHYRGKHMAVYKDLNRLDQSNGSEDQLRSVISTAHAKIRDRRNSASISKFFQPRPSPGTTRISRRHVASIPSRSPQQSTSANPASQGVAVQTISKPGPDRVLIQAVGLILYGCVKQAPLSQLSCPMLQGLIHICDGRMRFSSKTPVQDHLFSTYNAVCRLLKSNTENAMVGSITCDGWSAALRAPILGITWHYVDSSWRLKSMPIATRNIGTASKSAVQTCAILEDVMQHNPVVGSADIRVHTATTDNEAATARAADLYTNFVGSVRCVVHTIALAVNDVFTPESPWKMYMDVVNQVTSYFRHHTKMEQRLIELQLSEGVTRDRIERLKHDIQTRWHSRLSAMSSHMSRLNNIAAVANEFDVSSDDLPLFTQDQQDTMAEFITILSEVRRVARQLEADRKVTMSRSPRLLRELYEALLIMASEMTHTRASFYDEQPVAVLNALDVSSGRSSQACIPSIASSDMERDETRKIRLTKLAAKDLATQLADRIKYRLGHLWGQIDATAALWRPDDTACENGEDEDIDESMQKPRRTLLFHIAAMLDINECQFDFIDVSPLSRDAYINVVQRAVVREALELDEKLQPMADNLGVIFRMMHDEMLRTLRSTGRKEPNAALSFWKHQNEKPGMISPKPFNMVAQACLSSQASSAAAERLFGDLGKSEGNQAQEQLTSTIEMRELIRMFVLSETVELKLPQTGMIHPQADAFQRLVSRVSTEIRKE